MPLLLLGGLADVIGVDKTLLLIGLLIALAGAISVRIAPGQAPWRSPGRGSSLVALSGAVGWAGYTACRRNAARSCWNR